MNFKRSEQGEDSEKKKKRGENVSKIKKPLANISLISLAKTHQGLSQDHKQAKKMRLARLA